LQEISAEHTGSEGSTPADVQQFRVHNYHKAPETKLSAHYYSM
jgi:hypothetical protein